MIRWQRQFILTLLVLPLLGMSLSACQRKEEAPEEQTECGFVQNVYGQRISWKSNVPVQIYLHESFPDHMRPALEAAVKVWENRAGRALFALNYSQILTGPMIPRQDGRNILYWMDTWENEKASEQARTSVYWVSNEIQEADIRLNDKYFDFYLETPAGNRDVHLESLLIHELGHVLGLKHKDSGDSVMATYLSSLTMRNDIPEKDIDDLKCEY